MGKVVLLARLAGKDVRRHLAEAALLFLVIVTAATALTLGLVLHGVTANPYNVTRSATKGPDIVADLSPTGPGWTPGEGSIVRNATASGLAPLAHISGVTGSSGPYPVTFAVITADGVSTAATVEGRDTERAPVDDPELIAGRWAGSGGVVIERSFAGALGVRVGDSVVLGSERLRVAGIAVDAAFPPSNVCDVMTCPDVNVSGQQVAPNGLIWVTRATAVQLAAGPGAGLSYVLNLKLAHPAQAAAFAASHTSASEPALLLSSWQQISFGAAAVIVGPHDVLLAGSVLLIAIAIASVAILVGGRLAEQNQRVGLLKAVGATPGTVAAVLLSEHLAVTVVAAVVGLETGRLVAPLLSNPGAGLIGAANAPPLTHSTIVVVICVAVAAATLATLVPAIRAARTSTIDALLDAARPPRRAAPMVMLSARLPVPLLLGARLAVRRPRRLVLGALSVAITVAGIVDAVMARVQEPSAASIDDVQHQRIEQVLLVLTVMLVVLALVNALLITWSTVIDSQHAIAIARSLGATPKQVTAGLAATQSFSVVPGSLLGVVLGIGIFAFARGQSPAMPSLWWFLVVILGTWIAITTLTTIPARIGAHRPVAGILQGEAG
jgi:ABC-type lipoprotein release transport system permease subunit